MTVGIVTFASHLCAPDTGSTRIRVTWPLRYWPEAEEFTLGHRYDAVIFQKVYWVAYAAALRATKILDLCDPDFLGDAARCTAMFDHCDAITCSSDALTEHVATLTRTPVSTIPDRIDFAAVGSRRKTHRGRTATAAWFGYARNYAMLDSIVPALLRLEIPRLIVIAEPALLYRLPAEASGRIALDQRTWSETTIYRDLLDADVVLNPRRDTGEWRFKSLNKTTLAWALGLPVAHDGDELARLMTEDARRHEARRRLLEVRSTSDVRATVEDYRRLIAQTRARVRGTT
jgi:hypothetical protein